MPIASDQQVQAFCDNQIRPLVEQIRALEFALTACLGEIGDVYANVTQGSPTWHDTNSSNPPHLATPADVVNMNGLFTRVLAAITGDSQHPIMLNLCVRTP